MSPLKLVAAIAMVSLPTFAGPLPDMLWGSKCKGCHGTDGSGDTALGKKSRVPDLRNPSWQAGRTDADISRTLTEGGPKHPGYNGKLTPSEITLLVQHVRSLKRP